MKVISETAEETVVEVTVIDHERGRRWLRLRAPGASARREPARILVERLLKHMGIRAQVDVRPGAEPIIARHQRPRPGHADRLARRTLRALQSVTNLMRRPAPRDRERVIVDVERYRQRREHTVREIAMRAARQVKMTGDAITLDAMQPFEGERSTWRSRATPM